MLLDILYTRPGHLIRRLQQIAVAIFLEEMADANVTPVQYATLVAVRECPDLDIKRLANLIAVDRSLLGTVIDRFDKAGFVTRSVDPNDRRSRVVRISSAGEDLLKELEPKVAQAQVRILHDLSSDERDVFLNYLAQLVHANNELSSVPLRVDGIRAPLSIYDKPGYLIRRLQQICEGIFAKNVGHLDVTAIQYAALTAIADHPDVDNTTLAQLIGLDRATTGSVVNRLAAKGLVKDRVSATDLRSKSLRITKAGVRLLDDLIPAIMSADECVVASLSKTERLKFKRLLSKVVDLKNETSRAPQRNVTLNPLT
jgi:DNA-binding MarR family transcriptional regulator